MRVMSCYCTRIAKVKLNLCICIVSFGSSLDCSCLFTYSIVSVNFKRTTVLIRLNDDKVLRYRRNILLFMAKKKIKKRMKKYHVYPKPYLPPNFNKLIHLPVYLSEIARWETFSNDSITLRYGTPKLSYVVIVLVVLTKNYVNLSMHYVIILKTRVVLSIYRVDMPTHTVLLC